MVIDILTPEARIADESQLIALALAGLLEDFDRRIAELPLSAREWRGRLLRARIVLARQADLPPRGLRRVPE